MDTWPRRAAAWVASFPRRKVILLLYVFAVLFGYGGSMFINGIGKQVAPSRALISRDADVSATTRVLAGVLNPMFSLCTWRAASLLLILTFMLLRGDVPPVPDALSSRLLVPVLIGLTNSGGYLMFMMLSSMTGVSVWSSLIGCYIVVPVTFGILARGESRNLQKLGGIVVCIAGALMLALAQAAGGGNGGTADTPGFVSALLFLSSLAIWGACDTMGAYVHRGPRALHMFTIALFSMLGFVAMAWLCAAMTYILTATLPPPVDASTDATMTAFWTGQVIMFVAQFIGVCAWYSSVKLGSLSEASSFLPLTSLYTLISSVLGIIFLRESMPAMGYIGMVAAGGGALCIATADGMDAPGDAASPGAVTGDASVEAEAAVPGVGGAMFASGSNAKTAAASGKASSLAAADSLSLEDAGTVCAAELGAVSAARRRQSLLMAVRVGQAAGVQAAADGDADAAAPAPPRRSSDAMYDSVGEQVVPAGASRRASYTPGMR